MLLLLLFPSAINFKIVDCEAYRLYRAQCHSIHLFLHDRAGTFASLLYKGKMLSVCLYFFWHTLCSVVSTRIDARFARNEVPVFGDHA